MKVEIWSDIACPWCYVGKRRFEAALAEFAHRDEVDVEWKSFELDPGAVSAAGAEESPYAERLARKYGMSDAQAQQMLDHMTATAVEVGLELRFDKAVAANTFEAHQLIHLAGDHRLQDAMKERLLRAYFTEGAVLGDRAALERLAVEIGLDPAEVRATLDEGRFASTVRRDEGEAAALGISGVPFFVFDRKYGVSGAQPPQHLLDVLERTWSESRSLTVVPAAVDGETGETCGPDGCAL